MGSLQCLEPLCSWLPWNKDCKIATKVFLSNERALMSWFRTSVTLGTAGAAVVGFSGGKTGDEGSTKNYVGMSLCSIGAILVMYALFQFYRRARKIRLALEGPYEDLFGPGFAALLVIA